MVNVQNHATSDSTMRELYKASQVVNSPNPSRNTTTPFSSDTLSLSRAASSKDYSTGAYANLYEQIRAKAKDIAFLRLDATYAMSDILLLYKNYPGVDPDSGSDLRTGIAEGFISNTYWDAMTLLTEELQKLAQTTSTVMPTLEYGKGQEWFKLIKDNLDVAFDESAIPSEVDLSLKEYLISSKPSTNQEAMDIIAKYAEEKPDLQLFIFAKKGIPISVFIEQVRSQLETAGKTRVQNVQVSYQTLSSNWEQTMKDFRQLQSGGSRP
ncbi:MAG: hypothetical protein SFU25_03305 [Candidatus Caenarcaniphilales bacterium]|nr:hypothetical protein [Candidatus Caenarcaniphilales bacterium]